MMKRTKTRLFLSGAMIVGILCFIWDNSLLPGKDSGELSGFIGTLLQKLLPFLDLQSEMGMHLLRKAAHFSEFAALGMSFGWLFAMVMTKKQWKYLLPLGCGAAAACVDECIQIFSPGRYSSIVDVCIDCSGVLTGCLLLWLCIAILTKIKKKRAAQI
jgi:VanZ family protein